jgi:3-oxoacyl-[acyl-carrier-protein] synthase II
VVVTGIGALTCLGNTVADSWKAVCEGKSGIAPLTHLDAAAFTTRFGGSIRNFDITEYIPAKEARRMDLFLHYGIAAGMQAVRDSGLEQAGYDPLRIGVIAGSGIGGITTIEDNVHLIDTSGPRKISPFLVPGSIINMIAGSLSIQFNFQGPNFSITTACTTGTHNIGMAARLIAYGEADAMLTGSTEMASSPVGLGGFCAARALSTRNDDPTAASRPWDAERDGFVLSDGAGVLVLESLEHAQKRGANIYAELVGFGMNSDAYHMTAPSPNGEGAADCMYLALADATLNPEDNDYINAHGTSTPAGDKAETEAVKRVFKDHAYKLAMSSTKSMTGHALGAAGGIETIPTIMSIYEGVLAPTINLDRPDEGFDLNFVANTPQEAKVNVALNNTFGFGGHNTSAIFRKLE